MKLVLKSECKQDEITLIVTDFEMPMMSGLEAVKELKAFYKQLNHRIMKKNEKDLNEDTFREKKSQFEFK